MEINITQHCYQNTSVMNKRKAKIEEIVDAFITKSKNIIIISRTVTVFYSIGPFLNFSIPRPPMIAM
jgi:hypothetical protein